MPLRFILTNYTHALKNTTWDSTSYSNQPTHDQHCFLPYTGISSTQPKLSNDILVHSLMYLNNQSQMDVRHLESVPWLEDAGECGWALKLTPTLLWVYPQPSLSLLMWAVHFSILSTTINRTLWNCDQDISFFFSMVDSSYFVLFCWEK